MAVSLSTAILAAGCKHIDDEFAPAVLPKTYAFSGKFDTKYVGVWKSTDGSSTMEMSKDGNLKVETTTHYVGGKSVSNVMGQWLATSDGLMFRYTNGAKPIVLKYTTTLAGNSLTLKQSGGHMKTVYRRK